MQRISGRDVEARMAGGTRIAFEQATLDLDDGIVGTTSQGYPYGWVSGAVKGEGELQVHTEQLLALNAEAALAGSWEELAAFDLSFFAKVGALELHVEIFGVKLRMPNFDFKGDGGEKTLHTVRYVVSSPDFVRINGTPLARRPPAVSRAGSGGAP